MIAWADGHFESSDGLRLYYRDYAARTDSDALPVICLHGLTRNSRDFAAIADIMAAKRRVISFDFRGRGLSDYDSDWHHYHPYQYVDDVWRLLDRSGIERFITFGTSLGGWMSAIMAYQRTDAVAAAILNDIGPDVDPRGLARITEYAGLLPAVTSWDEAIEQTRLICSAALPGLSDDDWRYFTETVYRDVGDGTVDLNSDRNIGVAVREGVSGLHHEPWELFDAFLEVPILVLRGELSDILAEETVAKMHARYPLMQSATIRDRGHAPLLDEPDSIAAATGFLERVGSEP